MLNIIERFVEGPFNNAEQVFQWILVDNAYSCSIQWIKNGFTFNLKDSSQNSIGKIPRRHKACSTVLCINQTNLITHFRRENFENLLVVLLHSKLMCGILR